MITSSITAQCCPRHIIHNVIYTAAEIHSCVRTSAASAHSKFRISNIARAAQTTCAAGGISPFGENNGRSSPSPAEESFRGRGKVKENLILS
jgi:hypothetical protein